jgi:hypothetical protein
MGDIETRAVASHFTHDVRVTGKPKFVGVIRAAILNLPGGV